MKNKERIEQLENRIEALENHFAKTNKTIEPSFLTDLAKKTFGCELDESVTDVSKSYYDPTKDKMVQDTVATSTLNERTETAQFEQEATKSTDKECSLADSEQPDWENLLSEEDFCAPSYMTWYDRRNNLNKVLHERTKPLLDENVELRQRIEELEAEKSNQIDVPFALDGDGDLRFNTNNSREYFLYYYCKLNGINQTKIERITLTMESEEE
jgi:hypothetical protein